MLLFATGSSGFPPNGAAPGLLHKHETAHGQAPETNPLACSSTADQKEAPCPTRHLSRAAEVHQRTLVTTVKDMKEFLVHPALVLLLPVGSVVFQLRKAKQLYCVWKNSLCFLVLMDCISKLVVLLCFQRGDWLACFLPEETFPLRCLSCPETLELIFHLQ